MAFNPTIWDLRERSLTTADHTLVMGIVNVTPDSFSDGGRWIDAESAIRKGMELADLGADIVDVGGESTRPGAAPVDAAEERARVVPVVEALAAEGVVVSIDTSKPSVALAAIEVGAEIVNDVTGLSDPVMIETCSDARVGVVIMHMLGEPRTMQIDPTYEDVVTEVAEFLRRRTEVGVAAGIDASRIVVDPGIGFGKTIRHNLDLLNSIDRIGGGRPVLVGASRKAFLGTILDQAGRPSSPEDRDTATVATAALAVAKGAAVLRVHDVASAVDAARTADAIVRVR
ncbi:MAG: dihydropteroate synthase [Actinomycetota bacterium]|nr:dihydropteroate synthase [Actinomycetota bacterium]